MNIEGVLTKLDLGPGVWVVKTDDGKQVQVDGSIPEGLEGKRVKVAGSAGVVMGIGMTSDTVISATSIVRA